MISTSVVSDGEPIKLPENLESLPKAEHFPTQRHRWNTNEVFLYFSFIYQKRKIPTPIEYACASNDPELKEIILAMVISKNDFAIHSLLTENSIYTIPLNWVEGLTRIVSVIGGSCYLSGLYHISK